MRRKIIAANWKMQKTAAEAAAYLEHLLPRIRGVCEVDVVLAPPFTALDRVAAGLAGSAVSLAAQNVSANEDGAFTGEISPRMLAEFHCRYAIAGHSERRALYGETDEIVARKAALLAAHGITPIVCVGETLAEREADRTRQVVEAQLGGSLAEVTRETASEIVIAYEPVWAIGTGRTATAAQAQEVHEFIRSHLAGRFGGAAGSIRIQYGGSVKPENTAELMAQPDIDGALVGGASLDPDSFATIVQHAAAA